MEKGTYIVVNGPRLETAAEIRVFARQGADVVGMTAMPEAVLAREAEICFACIAVVTNAAAGITAGRLSAKEVIETMKASTDKIRALLRAFFSLGVGTSACACGTALQDARMLGVFSIRGVMQTILVIEDKDSMAQMLRETLEAEGYCVIIAHDGQDGLGRHPGSHHSSRKRGRDRGSEMGPQG